MKSISKIICIITLIFLIGCSTKYHVKESAEIKEPVELPGFEKYISCFFMGEVGTLPTGCEITEVDLIEDSAFVCGRAFDMDTQKPFNTDIWIGSFVEKSNESGKKDLYLSKRKFLSTTDSTGTFCLKVKVQKNEVMLMDQIGYDPAVFEVYHYLKDARLVE